MSHNLEKGVTSIWPFQHGSLSFVRLASYSLNKVLRKQGVLQGIFLPSLEVNYITSVQLYWSNLSQTSPDLRGGGIDPTSQWRECQRTWGPCQKWPQL